MKIHIVREQETLSGLATKYNVPVERIQEANPDIEQEHGLTAGLKIFIPTGRVTLAKPIKNHTFLEGEDSDLNDQQEVASDESSAYHWNESIPQPTQYCDEPYIPMQAENQFTPHAFPPMSPFSPVSTWNFPYQMLQTQSFPPQGPMPIQPYYYPYPLMPYPVNPYQSMHLSSEPYDDEGDVLWEESEQEFPDPVWATKESSSVSG